MRMMLWAAAALATGALSCGPGMNPTDGGADGTSEAGVPRFAEVQTIFDTSCAIAGGSCHATTGVQGGLDLSAGRSYAAIVGVASTEVTRLQRVTPNNPDQSYLYLKLSTAYQMLSDCMGAGASVCGAPMPMVSGTPLSSADRDTIRRWIAAGAPNM